MADFSLEAKTREVIGKKVRALRREGLVPGTIYGSKTDPISVQFVYRDVEVALMKAGGTNIIDIDIAGGKKVPVLARDVQRDVIKGSILHVDFFAVDMATKIRADVPVVLINESPLVAGRKAILLTGTNTVTIETLPDKLLNSIEVDLSVLEEIGDTIYIADLKLDDITIINDSEEMIAKIVQPSAARAEEALEALDGAVEEGELPEVIGESDDEDEDSEE